MWVQPDFPSMLPIKMIEGNINALTDPSSALISQSVAKALYNGADPIGKTIRINNKTDLKVAGFMKISLQIPRLIKHRFCSHGISILLQKNGCNQQVQIGMIIVSRCLCS